MATGNVTLFLDSIAQTMANLVFTIRVKPVQNRLLKPFFEPYLWESDGSWTAVIVHRLPVNGDSDLNNNS